jgi:hypothetical protein
VDPHVSTEQPGLTPESGTTNDGASYLRRLKAQTGAEEPSSAAASANATGEAAQNSFAGKERRRSPRFRCAGSAEFTAEGSNVRMWGTLTDISLRGCYVEMSTTFPVDTRVELVLEVLGIRVRAWGAVRISYPFLGMGILLTEIAPDQRALLEQLLSTLAKATIIPNAEATPESSATETIMAADPIAFLNELKWFFDSKAVLPREEFFRIAKRCRRS